MLKNKFYDEEPRKDHLSDEYVASLPFSERNIIFLCRSRSEPLKQSALL